MPASVLRASVHQKRETGPKIEVETPDWQELPAPLLVGAAGPTLPVRRRSIKDYKLQGQTGKGAQVPVSTARHQETQHNQFPQVILFIRGKTKLDYFKESESISPLSIGEEGICATGSVASLENLQK